MRCNSWCMQSSVLWSMSSRCPSHRHIRLGSFLEYSPRGASVCSSSCSVVLSTLQCANLVIQSSSQISMHTWISTLMHPKFLSKANNVYYVCLWALERALY
jgi:hypothetical protein